MFRALWLAEKGAPPVIRDVSEDELPAGEVCVKVEYSTLNYKDALALQGLSKVVRAYPMIPGIDLAGVVESSSSPEFKAGDRVVVNGWDLGEKVWGGLAERANLPARVLQRLPAELSTGQAMIIGTAGFTAMLAVLALEDHGLLPDGGPIVVTGASGGLGSLAIALLARAGFEVCASTGRMNEADYLKSLGATTVIHRDEFAEAPPPLLHSRWQGAIDAVGSTTLANILAATQYGGVVAACGLAQGMDLPTTVAPFILRGLTLAGINSSYAPASVRQRAWTRLASDLQPDVLEKCSVEISLDETPTAGEELLRGEIRGRLLVRTNEGLT